MVCGYKSVSDVFGCLRAANQLQCNSCRPRMFIYTLKISPATITCMHSVEPSKITLPLETFTVSLLWLIFYFFFFSIYGSTIWAWSIPYSYVLSKFTLDTNIVCEHNPCGDYVFHHSIAEGKSLVEYKCSCRSVNTGPKLLTASIGKGSKVVNQESVDSQRNIYCSYGSES